MVWSYWVTSQPVAQLPELPGCLQLLQLLEKADDDKHDDDYAGDDAYDDGSGDDGEGQGDGQGYDIAPT